MLNKNIKYIAFYSIDVIASENRQSTLSATNKIDYICSALVKNNYEVEIISPSWSNNNKGLYKGRTEKVSENVTLKTFATFGAKNKITRILKYFFSLIQLFLFLLFKTKKNEQVLVYHSIILVLPIKIAMFIKKFNVILEVEEVYQDAQPMSKFMKKNEIMGFQQSNKYLLSTELLNNRINISNKPNLTIYGTYRIEDDRNVKFNDDKIHIVYAGTFDPRKGGALAAISATKHLPQNYHMHIIGFGSSDQVKNVLDKIEEVSAISQAIITYDGLLKGDDYIKFLQKCHIGLSTQLLDASYNETSFPSKILSYLANGLRVVTVRLKVIEKSQIGDIVYYYESQEPNEIANAITRVDFSIPYNSRKRILKLDDDFIVNLGKLIED